MLRFLVTILFTLISFSFIGEVVLSPKYAVTKTVLAEEEQQQEADNNNQGKSNEENLKEKFFADPLATTPYFPAINTSLAQYNHLHYSTGFAYKPYMPPDLM